MRNPERLDEFYEKIKELHKKYCPDWRFGQLMSNFADNVGDIFYWEEDAFLESFEEYLKKNFEEEIMPSPEKKIQLNEAQAKMIEAMKGIVDACEDMGECRECPFNAYCCEEDKTISPYNIRTEVEKWEQ